MFMPSKTKRVKLMSSETRKGGRPPVDSERIDTRFRREVLDALDAWREAQPDKPSRPEAVRRLVDQALAGNQVHSDGATAPPS